MSKTESLEDIMFDISDFLSLKDGESFEGKFIKAEKVPSGFNPEDLTVQLTFEIDGQEKKITGARLAKELLKIGVKEGESAKVTRVSTKGTKVEWKVEKIGEVKK